MIGPSHIPNLQSGPIGLRSIRTRDAPEWRALRARNRDWLMEWDATSPAGAQDIPPTFAAMVRSLRAEARAGRTLPWVITYSGRVVGQLTVGGIAYGSLRSAHIGYWVDRNHAGRGIVPTAVALGADYCFYTLGLHRLEINLRPENAASRRVVEKLGFRYEGIRENFLHINGQWRDHLAYAATVEDAPNGVMARLQQLSATQ
ncbi:MAG: GNAT family N-acetyltransferase [Actinobacteria bacterium]|nr:GNAT family N-acetyltransferase [Actinomycetota bacterium]